LQISSTRPTTTKMMANNKGDIIVSGLRLCNEKGIFPLLAVKCKKTSAVMGIAAGFRIYAYFVTNFCNHSNCNPVYNNTTLRK
ncbi:MAG: hypothetical protein B7Z18_12500, partial [Alishewanella sp. 32-51-5]